MTLKDGMVLWLLLLFFFFTLTKTKAHVNSSDPQGLVEPHGVTNIAIENDQYDTGDSPEQYPLIKSLKLFTVGFPLSPRPADRC